LHILQRESLTEVRINGEHRQLGQSHSTFQWTMIGKLAQWRKNWFLDTDPDPDTAPARKPNL